MFVCSIITRAHFFIFTLREQTELASYLGDFSLSTDTAAGALALQKLSEDHHCGATLTVQPYKGLRKVRTVHTWGYKASEGLCCVCFSPWRLCIVWRLCVVSSSLSGFHIIHLIQEVSARRVAVAVALHVQGLGWVAQRRLDPDEDWQLILQHLDDASINADGVIHQIRSRLDYVR